MSTAEKSTIPAGTACTIPDENGRPIDGLVRSYGQANDGTGRLGYWVETGPGTLYWRTPAAVARR